MAHYRLQLAFYQAPDRGDPHGGFSLAAPYNFEAVDDDEAWTKAMEHLRFTGHHTISKNVEFELLKVIATQKVNR